MKKQILLILALFIIFPLLQAQQAETFTFDCFSVLVGKDATADGAIYFAHNEDDWGNRLVNWYQVPAQHHEAGSFRTLKNGGQLAFPEQTWALTWMEMPEMDFSDSYMNEWGVTIGSDACLSKEKNPDLTDGGIGYFLRRAIAERAKTAREAVKIGGALVDQFGYASSGRTYCIADSKEAWMLSVVNGKHWIAQRVPDDEVAIIPNYYTIGEIDLTDTVNFYGSPDLVDYAMANNWYDPDKNGSFNFREVYSDEGNLKNHGNIVRHWSAINHLFTKTYGVGDDFPFSFKPDKKIELADLFAVLRNHNEGSEFDLSDNYARSNPHEQGRAICSRTTQYGFVAQLRDHLPAGLGSVLWMAPFRPCVHAFTPWYLGIDHIPAGFAEGDYSKALEKHFNPIEDVFTYAPNSRFLRFVKNAKSIDEDYGNRITSIRTNYLHLENQLFDEQKSFEKKMMELYQTHPEELPKALREYVEKQLHRAELLMEK